MGNIKCIILRVLLSVRVFQESAKKLPVSLFVYMALDGDGQLMAETKNNQLSDVVGRSQGLGDFRLVFPKPATKVWHNYLISYTPRLDKITETVRKAMRLFPIKSKSSAGEHYAGLIGKAMPEGMSESRANLIVYQVSYNCLTGPHKLAVFVENLYFYVVVAHFLKQGDNDNEDGRDSTFDTTAGL